MNVLVRPFRSSSHILFAALLAAASLGLLALSPAPAHGQNTYVVDSNGDAVDANPGDGTCATAGGDCTLRAAIQEANQTTNNDNIEFSLPTTGSFATITPSEEFQITEPVTIDGTTSPEYPSSLGGPAIVLDGSSLSSSLEDGIEKVGDPLVVGSRGDSHVRTLGLLGPFEIVDTELGIGVEQRF